MKSILLEIIVGVALTLLFFFLGAFLSGAGHSLTAMTIFFPYGMAIGTLLENTRWEFVGGVLMLLQFPFYSLLFSSLRGIQAKKLGVVAAAAFVVHVAATILAITPISDQH